MAKETNLNFCIECRKDTEYELKEEIRTKIIKDKVYEYKTIVAYCKDCGEEMSLPGLNDKDMELFDKQYRNIEGIISIEEIAKIMEIYNIGKAPLSLALGFGEITVSRYLEGQMPSKKYSDIMREVLYNYEDMENKLYENKEKVGEVAFRKAIQAIDDIKLNSKASIKIQMVIHYVLNAVVEITPLALQKLLYFAQGLSFGINGKELFEDDCEAWVHGPVYPEVYYQYKQYGYNPIEDQNAAIFNFSDITLSTKETKLINSVIETFGMYSGKILENITHKENPWIIAREGVESIEYSKNIISKETIKKYFVDLGEKYNFIDANEILRYIADKLKEKL
jgi:uncharacterized phage-associated protein